MFFVASVRFFFTVHGCQSCSPPSLRRRTQKLVILLMENSPAPVDMVNSIYRVLYIPGWLTGFLPSTVDEVLVLTPP